MFQLSDLYTDVWIYFGLNIQVIIDLCEQKEASDSDDEQGRKLEGVTHPLRQSKFHHDLYIYIYIYQ